MTREQATVCATSGEYFALREGACGECFDLSLKRERGECLLRPERAVSDCQDQVFHKQVVVTRTGLHCVVEYFLESILPRAKYFATEH